MKLLAIDPGNKHSGFVALDGRRPVAFGKWENESLLGWIEVNRRQCWHLAIETLYPRGMPTSFEEMQTQLWAGRFIQAFSGPFTQVYRHQEKMALCGRAAKVTDSNIRQAIIDLYGGKEAAIGKKKTPGPLYGIKADAWQAMAVAITFLELHKEAA